MCLIVFAWRPGHALPLVVAANRDESHGRPSLPLARWGDTPQLIAGRDLQAGGTWLGVGDGGRFAAVTNIRAPGGPLGHRSRGELPSAFLRGEMSPQAYLTDLARRAGDYSGFNLLVGDSQGLWYLNSHEGVARALQPGLYGLSNAALDTPWPKLLKARSALAACLDAPQAEHLLRLLADPHQAGEAELPCTGVPMAVERLLSSVFIRGGDYGTRASTVLIRHADSSQEIIERSFGPHGVMLGQVRLTTGLNGAAESALQHCGGVDHPAQPEGA